MSKPTILRIIIATVFVTLFVACTYLGGIPFLLFLMVLALISINELYNMMRVRNFLPAYYIGNFFTVFFLIFSYYALKKNWEPAHSAIFTGAAIVTMIATLFLKRGKEATIDTALTLMGIIYVGWFYSYCIFVQALTPRGEYFLYVGATLLIVDSAAYLIGKKFGKTKLFPLVSPKKTIEGALAGFVSGIVFGLLCAYFTNQPIFHFVIMGILMGILAQLGDLFESLIKRDAGVKNSSNILPEHGGILDRIDSYTFTVPILYYYLVWFVVK